MPNETFGEFTMTHGQPLRVLIVDDEPFARDSVRLVLDRHGGVEVVAECGDGEGAVGAIRAHDPDLVFLDVQMPGLDGFGVIERIGPQHMPLVVFVTAYNEHAIHAFDVHALDYVLKPFDDSRLLEAVERARARLARERNGETARALTALLALRPETAGGGRDYVQRIMVSNHDYRLRFVRVEAIASLEADGNYVVIHADGKHRIRMTLTALLQQLDPRRFVRIHRSIVVNLDHIRELQPWYGGDYVAIMHDGRQLRVSRRYRSGLLRTTL